MADLMELTLQERAAVDRSKWAKGCVAFLVGFALLWQLSAARGQTFYKPVEVGSNGGHFNIGDGISIRIPPFAFDGSVTIQVVNELPPQFAAQDAVSNAVSVLVTGDDPIQLEPVALRFPVVSAPDQGSQIDVWFLPPSPGYDPSNGYPDSNEWYPDANDWLPAHNDRFPDSNEWFPEAPFDARSWHTSDPLAFPDSNAWLVGYDDDVGWVSGSPDVHVVVSRPGTYMVRPAEVP